MEACVGMHVHGGTTQSIYTHAHTRVQSDKHPDSTHYRMVRTCGNICGQQPQPLSRFCMLQRGRGEIWKLQ